MSWTGSDFERLDPKFFRGFLAVVKTGSFSDAARLAHLTQGAISQQVAKLESRLGCRLFERQNPGLSLTPAGILLAEFARQWLDSSTALAERLQNEARSMAGRVRVGVDETALHSENLRVWLLRAQKCPELVPELHVLAPERLQADLLHGELDFTLQTQPHGHELLISQSIGVLDWVLAGRPSAMLRPHSMLELLSQPFIFHPDLATAWPAWCVSEWGTASAPALSELDIRATASDQRAALQLVQSGLGLSLIASPIVDACCKPPAMPHGFALQGQAQTPLYLSRHRQRYQSHRVQSALQWLHTVAVASVHTALEPA